MAIWITAAAAVVAVLAAGLPPDGFFSGDSGVNLIAARAAIAHPSRPLEVDLPSIGGRPAPYVDPMFAIHGDHLDPLQAPLFPILTAPLVALFGLRGVYVLPAVAFVLLIPLFEALRKRAMPDVSPHFMAAIALFANPIFFYAFEFWGHAPAIALCAGATVLSWPDGGARWRIAAAGALMGVAMLLRPEAAWYLAGLLAASRRARPMLLMIGGAAAVLAPAALGSYAHSGNLLGAHLASNLAPLGDHWMRGRLTRAAVWLLPGATEGMMWHRDLFWAAWPLGLVLLVPRQLDTGDRRLIAIAAVAAAGIILTATHDGGAQWGPRFLLITTPALLPLAAAAAWRLITRPGHTRALRWALVGVVLAASVWSSRAAYVELRGAKRGYAALVAHLAALTPDGGIIVTDVWWLDQIAAPLHGRRVFLVASDDAEARMVAGDLEAAGVRAFMLVDGDEPPGALAAAIEGGGCYTTQPAGTMATRNLRVSAAVASGSCQAR